MTKEEARKKAIKYIAENGLKNTKQNIYQYTHLFRHGIQPKRGYDRDDDDIEPLEIENKIEQKEIRLSCGHMYRTKKEVLKARLDKIKFKKI